MIIAIVERYWRRVERRSTNECWPWRGHKNVGGYGLAATGAQTGKGAKYITATHVALVLDGRVRPSPAHYALHRCDNPVCVNPGHLWWGTKQENSADMIAKGRSRAKRLQNGDVSHPGDATLSYAKNRRLTPSQVRYIRASPKTLQALADELGVTNQCVSKVRLFQSYQEVR